jgi:hypothetical protein
MSAITLSYNTAPHRVRVRAQAIGHGLYVHKEPEGLFPGNRYWLCSDGATGFKLSSAFSRRDCVAIAYDRMRCIQRVRGEPDVGRFLEIVRAQLREDEA